MLSRDVYVSFAKGIGDRVSSLLGLKRERSFEDMRNFMLPAILQGQVIPGSSKTFFLRQVEVSNTEIKGTVVFACALSKGAPSTVSTHTLRVYEAMTKEDAGRLLSDQRLLFLYYKGLTEMDMKLAASKDAKLRNCVGDTFVVYEGVEYPNDISPERAKDLEERILVDLKQIGMIRAELQIDPKKSVVELARLNLETSIKKQIKHTVNRWWNEYCKDESRSNTEI